VELHGGSLLPPVLVRPPQSRTTLSLNTGYFAILLVPGHSIGQRQVSVPLHYTTRSWYFLPVAV